jgi:hypothetical protein
MGFLTTPSAEKEGQYNQYSINNNASGSSSSQVNQKEKEKEKKLKLYFLATCQC